MRREFVKSKYVVPWLNIKATFVLSVLAVFLFLSEARADHSPTFILIRAPQISPAAMAKIWTPFVAYLSSEAGVKIELKVYGERQRFHEDLVAGVGDLIYGNPGYFIVARELHGQIPLVRSGRGSLKGILVARKDDNITSVGDLAGRKLAFPSKDAFAASIFLRAKLREDFGLEFTPSYVGGHDSVYRNVANGKYVAGGGVHRTLSREPAELRDELKIIYETVGLPMHPLSASPRIPKETRDAIRDAVLNLTETEAGREMLDGLKINEPVAADFDSDYKSMRNLALQMYSDLLPRSETAR